MNYLYSGMNVMGKNQLLLWGGEGYSIPIAFSRQPRQSSKIKRICKQCEKIFYVKLCRIKKGRGKFCSKKCLNEWKKTKSIKIKCPYCGKEFITSKKYRRKFCSQFCYLEYKKEHPKKIKKICPVCKNIFYEYAYNIEKRGQKFCSNKCSGIARTTKVGKSCIICGKSFKVKLSEAKNGYGIYCSRKCMGVDRKETAKGKRNPNWRGGGSKEYQDHRAGREWEKLRIKIYKRDNYTCQICGIKNAKFHAHHIIPWRISHDDSLGNLVTLCPKCHKKLEWKWIKQEKK